MSQYAREQFENWVSDFIASDYGRRFTDAQSAAGLLVEFLLTAREKAGGDLLDVGQTHMKDALTATAAKYKMHEEQLQRLPDLCAALLEYLEREGRLSDGRTMGLYLKSFRGTLNKPKTFVRPGAKVGRNDPCPCGSGKKYKQCCINLLP